METIKTTVQSLHETLKDYIEANYHICAPSLIQQRKKLLNIDGVIHRTPYLESTPRYKTGDSFSDMDGLPLAAQKLFESLSKTDGVNSRIIYDPPYLHQAESLKQNLISQKNLVIMTGTGSGKTESFLLPILGKFAKEAEVKPESFSEQHAMRALVLYPMNALVNDQLGRLRNIMADPRLIQQFMDWCGRPPRFARYTSRTPYAGIRTSKKDTAKLQSFDNFYIDVLRRIEDGTEDDKKVAKSLYTALKNRGKWPGKPDLRAWFGQKGSPWLDKSTGQFVRAVTQVNDSELLTRHEIQLAPPDLLVTNYSMLEYMLMRPIERPIFDKTKDWLAKNPDENFLIVLDEAHLYRGASGAEVGLLLRRLRDRLEISEDRFKVICATASFKNASYAPEFGSQLSGVAADTFVAIRGELALRQDDAKGNIDDAKILSEIDLDSFYRADEDEQKKEILKEFFGYFGVESKETIELALYEALHTFPPMNRLINETMVEARPLDQLGSLVFDESVPDEEADRAVTALLGLGSIARPEMDAPGLIPCRVHNFYRGLAGLWVCMDPDCSELEDELKDGISGKMYSQPMERCDCGSRVLEFFTCRNCGTAYARAYTHNLDNPESLWSEPGEVLEMVSGRSERLKPIDLLLESPLRYELIEPVDYDLETGQLNPLNLGTRYRTLHICQNRLVRSTDEDSAGGEPTGRFIPCAVCNQSNNGKGYVQDHQTKGDQPFQALLTKQIQIQRPGPQKATTFAPLRGRKVLAFSDSRQVAARLAPNIQMFSERDSLRTLIIAGYKQLAVNPTLDSFLSLEDLYLGVLVASNLLNVRLRPELSPEESFDGIEQVQKALSDSVFENPAELMMLLVSTRSHTPPKSLLSRMLTTLTDKFWGMESLGLATLREKKTHTDKIKTLPDIPGIAETNEEKIALARFWIRCWARDGFHVSKMPISWINRSVTEGFSCKTKNPNGKISAIDRLLQAKPARDIFWKNWSPELQKLLTASVENGFRYLKGDELSLEFEGDWMQCPACKSVHRPISSISFCVDCNSDLVKPLEPELDMAFLARKNFYRKPVMEALNNKIQPMSLIAAEHTAQLNAPQNEDVFSKAEENELLFQDIELNGSGLSTRSSAIDILSSTTTMEVGIDLGALSGVALRNMPPGRANYQQRAGRAGRRGNSVATVVAFGSSDSHDEHYFSKPDEMIRGDVIDPKLTLDNLEISKRHIRAFLLQNYHNEKLPIIDPDQPHDLFSVLGSVESFKDSSSVLNRNDFELWLKDNETKLAERLAKWIPGELTEDNRQFLLNNFVEDCIKAVDEAVALESGVDELEDDSVEKYLEAASEVGTPDKLLDRLLYCGKLPRYAFPTDVATFNVFDKVRSTGYKAIMKYAPSQGLPIALSQYAPDKQVWIAGKCYTSGAIYSVMPEDRAHAWSNKRLYMECTDCGFARTYEQDEGVTKGDTTDCEACGGEETFGPARNWMRPPGFAHPIDVEEVTSPDEIPETSYATRAKLTMRTPDDDQDWIEVNEQARVFKSRQYLLVTNTGPEDEGYSYCVKCGRIESSVTNSPILASPHPKPFPDKDDSKICSGSAKSTNLVLGTDFITDIALFSLRVAAPLKLNPRHNSTHVALRTLSEALAKAACQILEVEPGEMMAEYRPARTPAGKAGLEAEIFLYDTLPGGAGFASQLADKGNELFNDALEILRGCPAGCDASCYRCLRSFKNKFDHKLLDRHVGSELLMYLLSGEQQEFDKKRLRNSTQLLFNDLQRQSETELDIKSSVEITDVDGEIVIAPILLKHGAREFIVSLSGPLTSEHPADPKLAELRESSPDYDFIVVNELIVRANLPSATTYVLEQLST